MEDNDIAQLKDYAGLENTNFGIYCAILCHIADYGLEDYASEEFVVALKDEITKQLLNFKYNTVIKEEVSTRVETIRFLEWK